MRVRIQRFDPFVDKEPYFQTFDIPNPKSESCTAMDILDYILTNYDSSISYYRHSVCNHGICGRCTLKINDKIRLACACDISNYNDLCIEPVPNKKIIKDLVTE
jgi:succinate dehydrogenase / fumarate reductase, iron-sulfur subunit